MSKQSIQDKIEIVKNETQDQANSKIRIGEIFTLLNNEKLDSNDAFNKDEINELLQELNELISSGLKGVLKVADAKPANSAVGKYELSDVGTYNNLVPIIPVGSNTPSNTPIVTESTYINSVYWDGTNFIQLRSTIPQASPSSLIVSGNISNSVNGKAVSDYAPSKTSLGFKVFNIGDNIAPELSNSNFSDSAVWGSGYFDNTGAIIASSTIKYSKIYYPVVPGTYTSNVQLATGVPMSFILYDENKNFVSFISNKLNIDWNFTVAIKGFVRPCKLISQASELDYIKTLQVYEAGLTDNIIVSRSYADNNLLKTTDRVKIETILQPKFFLNATRNLNYSAFLDIKLTGGNEADLKDSSGNWLELYLVFIRVKELNGTTTSLFQIAKKNPDTGVVAVNNISVSSGISTENLVGLNGMLKISLLPVAGSNLSFDILINASKISLSDTNIDLGNTLKLNTQYLFENKKQASTSSSVTIVRLGDSIDEFDTSSYMSSNGWTVYNCGFGGCRMGRHNLSTSSGVFYNEMCFFRVADYIATGNFAPLENAAESLFLNNGDDNRPIVARLKAINWLLVDYINVSYGTNDYAATTAANSIPMGVNTDLLSDGSTFKGAINYGIKRILEAYPHIQIVFTTPIYRNRYNAVDDGLNSDIYANDRGYMLRDYANAVIEIADLNHVESLDLNRMSGINKYTASKFISADGVHPTPYGYILLEKRKSGKIKSMF